jgi:hypothetical protein
VTDARSFALGRVEHSPGQEAVAVDRSGRIRRFALDVVHLVVLWSLAVAQPLFEVLGSGASFFAARGSSRSEILVFAVALVLAPAAVLAVGELVVWIALGRRARRLAHGSFIAFLLALIAIQALGRTALSSADALIAISCLLGLAGAISYSRFKPARSTVTALSPAPVLFLALFLLNSPVSKLVLPGSAQAAVSRIESGPPIVFVVFDEFSVASLMDESLNVDPVRFPNFASLADTSTWFRNDATVNLGTDQAVPALLTGRFVARSKLPVLRDHPDNLFTLLEGAYRMNVHETLTRLCPARSCPRDASGEPSGDLEALVSDVAIVYGHVVLPGQLADRLPSISTTWGDFRGAELDGRALTQESAFDEFVNSISSGTRPTLNFLHVEVPHVPWRYLPSGQRYDVHGLDVPGLVGRNDTWGRDPSLVRQGQQRYLLQVGFVDRLLGRLITKLRATGLFDRAVVVVTADHGVSFRAGEGRRTTYRNRQDLAFVPLFVKLPHQRDGRVIDRVVQSIDVLPTIADAAKISIPWRLDGRSALRSRDLREVTVEGATFDAAELVARRDRGVRSQVGLFGSRSGWDRVLAGPPDLPDIGQDASQAPTAHFADLRAVVADEDRLRVVAPSGSVVPSLISGTIAGSDAVAGIELVAAVNGRVAGYGRTFRDSGGVAFSTLVSEKTFRAGSNTVEIFAVDRGPEGSILQSIARVGGEQATTYRLVGKTDTTIVSSKGQTFRVVPGTVQGMLDAVEVADGQARFTGWAGSLAARRPRDLVLVFSNGRFVYSFRTVQRGSRPDLPKGLADAGFTFGLPVDALGPRPSVRVFGVIGDKASELTPPPSYTRSGNG